MSRRPHDGKPCPTRPYELVIGTLVPPDEYGNIDSDAHWTYGYLAVYDFTDENYTYWILRPAGNNALCHDLDAARAVHPSSDYASGEGRLLRDKKWDEDFWNSAPIRTGVWEQNWMPYIVPVPKIIVPTFTTIAEAEAWLEVNA
jgi:hypothetical protein